PAPLRRGGAGAAGGARPAAAACAAGACARHGANGRGSRCRSTAGGPPRPRSRAPLGARRGCGSPRVDEAVGAGDPVEQADEVAELRSPARPLGPGGEDPLMLLVAEQQTQGPDRPDRKSTRLNSSHVKISYAV